MPPRKGATRRKASTAKPAESYKHSEATSPMRPEVGTQTRFKKKLPPAKFRYDDSLAPAMEWDGQNPARDKGEWLLGLIEEASALPAPHHLVPARELKNGEGEVVATVAGLRDAVAQLKAIGKPFLNWSGKAERTSFDVPSLPLFIHERLSTKAILETLKGHKQNKQTDFMDQLFGYTAHSVTDQVTKAYEYPDEWTNRMILGDSLVAMNSLLKFEQLGGQVQMIYMDPPYGISFGSNFQPFVRKRDVRNGDDADMTREPEMVQAYRDTWELGLHSYLSYLRDRLLLARELLTATGSIFLQISDENLHHVRELMDGVFGAENFVVCFLVKKTGSQKASLVEAVNDYLVWYAKDIDRVGESFSKLYERVPLEQQVVEGFNYVELPDGEDLPISELVSGKTPIVDYVREPQRIFEDFPGARVFAPNPLTSGGYRKNQSHIYRYKNRDFDPGIARGSCWKHTVTTDDGSTPGMDRLANAGRLFAGNKQLRFKRYVDDFGYKEITNWWDGLGGASDPIYVVQTSPEIVKRCLLMTTSPGDLVLDPTCGSGTTAYTAEQWGRRWITIDTSRVPLALARQRLLTATFDWYELANESRGPIGGFVYRKKQNRRGEQVGGIVPHISSSTIANDEPAIEEVIVQNPETQNGVIRVSGPFCFEATIPTPMEWDEEAKDAGEIDAENTGSFIDRMIEVLRRSPVLRLEGNRTVTLKSVRPPAKSLSLSAEALVDATADGQAATLADAMQEAKEKSGLALPLSSRPVAFVFGPENGAVNIRLVEEAAREAYQKSYTHLYVIGFAIQPNAREAIEVCEQVSGIPATYVQATPDLMMGDLLKNMRSSQIFSVCGLPEIEVSNAKPKEGEAAGMKQVELLGLDVFDPTTMEVSHRAGDDVPAWFLDSDYNGMCFRVSQAFFPRTKDWEKLKKALKGEFDDSVWEHLAGTTSAPFVPGENNRIAVKVIDDRGNELLVVRAL